MSSTRLPDTAEPSRPAATTSLPVRAWHAVLALVVLVAFVGQLLIVLDEDRSVVNFLSYFTIQSNLLVLVASLLVVIRPDRESVPWRLVRLAGLVGITVTGVVYAVAIGPYVDFEGVEWWYDKLFHYVVPIMALAGHAFLRPRTRFAWRDLAFIAWPLAWLAYTLVRGRSAPGFLAPDGTSSYPYDFLDVDKHGTAAVAVACVVVTLLMLGVAAIYVRTSRLTRRG